MLFRAVLFTMLMGLLAGCGGRWSTDFDAPLPGEVSRGWTVARVEVAVPPELSVSDSNLIAPRADIVWHGDPAGDRRAQVAAVIRDGVLQGTSDLAGPRPVAIGVTLSRFHAVTPRAVSAAPSAVHDIVYTMQVFDAETATPLTPATRIMADLEALTGSAAVVAAQEGRTQKARIRSHIAQVTRAWLGIGPDVRRTFVSLGR